MIFPAVSLFFVAAMGQFVETFATSVIRSTRSICVGAVVIIVRIRAIIGQVREVAVPETFGTGLAG